MRSLLRFAEGIDWFNTKAAAIASWAVVIACIVSAANATVRDLFGNTAHAWLGLQWYLFAFMVMLGAALVLKVNEHVRVDILYSKLGPRARAAIDLLGLICLLMPAALLITKMSWPWFWDAFNHGQTSNHIGGLIGWPAKLAIPLGFALLTLQGISEIIKRIGFLSGRYPIDTHYERPLQ